MYSEGIADNPKYSNEIPGILIRFFKIPEILAIF